MGLGEQAPTAGPFKMATQPACLLVNRGRKAVAPATAAPRPARAARQRPGLACLSAASETKK